MAALITVDIDFTPLGHGAPSHSKTYQGAQQRAVRVLAAQQLYTLS